MKLKHGLLFGLLFGTCALYAQPEQRTEKAMGLEEIRTLIQQNRSIIMENLNKEIASDNYKQEKSFRLPELQLNGIGYLSNEIPLKPKGDGSNSFLYNFNIASEFDVYTGGMHHFAIKRMQKDQEISEEKLKAVEQEVELQAFVLLYDIHRNLKYQDFIRSSILLREKEYERIEQLFKNGLVLKSDLLRSKLYITDLQKDEVTIKNSIEILSDKLCSLLGMKESHSIVPLLAGNLHYSINESFEDLYQYALLHSPELQMHRTQHEKEQIALKEIRSANIPHFKIYAQYGVGSPLQSAAHKHQLGGEVGAKMSFSISSFYKNKHQKKAQQQRIIKEAVANTEAEENLRNTLYELYTRYHESLLNINRALEKIDMSKESTRILNNSYFNQQALLIDVLESETQSMQASFEWVEAVVDSQKYYWALKQICGYLD